MEFRVYSYLETALLLLSFRGAHGHTAFPAWSPSFLRFRPCPRRSWGSRWWEQVRLQPRQLHAGRVVWGRPPSSFADEVTEMPSDLPAQLVKRWHNRRACQLCTDQELASLPWLFVLIVPKPTEHQHHVLPH